jgi:hypothetical protein
MAAIAAMACKAKGNGIELPLANGYGSRRLQMDPQRSIFYRIFAP